MKLLIQLLLWIVIGFLGYLTFNAIYEPIKFNKVKEARYQKVIDKLVDIRKSEEAYKKVTGRYTKNFDSLVRFIDTAQFTITQRRDTTTLDKEYKKNYGVDKYKDSVIVDTLGKESVKKSLFKNSDRYKTMMDVPHTDGVKFDLEAGEVSINDSYIPVFEAKVAKKDVLADQNKDLIYQENHVISVDGVNGEYISVGSMRQVNTTGNWPKEYDPSNRQ